jgi:hypothetical protein
MATEAKKDPKAFKQKLKKEGKQLATKALSSQKAARKATKPGSRQASKSK